MSKLSETIKAILKEEAEEQIKSGEEYPDVAAGGEVEDAAGGDADGDPMTPATQVTNEIDDHVNPGVDPPSITAPAGTDADGGGEEEGKDEHSENDDKDKIEEDFEALHALLFEGQGEMDDAGFRKAHEKMTADDHEEHARRAQYAKKKYTVPGKAGKMIFGNDYPYKTHLDWTIKMHKAEAKRKRGLMEDLDMSSGKVKDHNGDETLDNNEEYEMNPTDIDYHDEYDGMFDPEDNEGDPMNIKDNGMGSYLMPVAAMGTYMRESLESIINENVESVKIDLSFVKPLFEGQGDMSEDFMSKATLLLEAACQDRVKAVSEKVLEAASSAAISLYEQKIQIIEEAMDQYANEVASEWMKQNEIAVKTTARHEIMESFMDSLKALFLEHYVEIPDNKVNLLESLQERASKLESSVSDEIGKGLEVKKQLAEAQKTIAWMKATKGMTDMQVEKIKPLCEGIEFKSEEDYITKIKAVSTMPPAPVKTPILEDVGSVIKEPEPMKQMTMVEMAVQRARDQRSNI